MTDTETTDLIVIDTTATMIAAETELRNELAPVVREALARKDATALIAGRMHYTRIGLLAIAGHLNVSCAFDMPRDCQDPMTGAHGHEVRCTATRSDGVSQQAIGFASCGETRVSHDKCRRNDHKCEDVPRWDDFFAIRSMAQTRAQVRALNALLLPAIQMSADPKDERARLSSTPAEDMPPERAAALRSRNQRAADKPQDPQPPVARATPATAAATPAAEASAATGTTVTPLASTEPADNPRALIEWARATWQIADGGEGAYSILKALESTTWGDALGYEGVDGDWALLAQRLQAIWKGKARA